MSPTIAGLLLAAFLSWGTAQLSAGMALRRVQLLLTPEETAPPPIIAQARAASIELNNVLSGPSDCLRAIHADPALRALHSRILPPPEPRRPGEIDPFTAVAIAKLGEARSIEDAALWLQQKERLAVLNNRALLERLGALPSAPAEK
jgi:membrane glycosyltransferase